MPVNEVRILHRKRFGEKTISLLRRNGCKILVRWHRPSTRTSRYFGFEPMLPVAISGSQVARPRTGASQR